MWTNNHHFILKDQANWKEYEPVKNLLDFDKIYAAIVECLIKNDDMGILEIIENYIYIF